MIETVQARCDISTLHGNGMDVVRMLSSDVRSSGLWKYAKGNGATTKGGRVRVTVMPVGLGTTKGKMQVLVEGNLVRLLYGDKAKALTLPPPDVAAGVAELIRAARVYLPTLAPSDPLAWKLSRVDANATWDVAEGDAVDLLRAAGQSLWDMDGRTAHATTSQGGRHSWLHKASEKEQVAVYCKSTESDYRTSDDARLVRLECRVFSGKARRTYGETLADLNERGAVVAMGKVEAWSQKIGRSFVGESMGATFEALVRSGMAPADAAKMLGPTVLLGHYGVKGCTDDLAIPQRTVYRWAEVLRNSGTRAEELAGGYGMLPPAEAATFADAHFDRLAPAPDDEPVVHGSAAATDDDDDDDPELFDYDARSDSGAAPWDRGYLGHGDPCPTPGLSVRS